MSGLAEKLRTTWPLIKAGPVTTEQRELIHEAAIAVDALETGIEALDRFVAEQDADPTSTPAFTMGVMAAANILRDLKRGSR